MKLSVDVDRSILIITYLKQLVTGVNFRDQLKPIDRFSQIPTVGSYRIPTLRVGMSVHNSDTHRISSVIGSYLGHTKSSEGATFFS